jgi:AAHS family 4-hydroxybenzoate transporter-like MFS transporter
MIDIVRLIDEHPISALQVRIVAICALVALVDGIDNQVIGGVASSLAKDLDIKLSLLGTIFSAGLFGAAVGSLIFGPLADRFGRKPMLIACLLLFAVFTALTATASSYQSLLMLRFAAGLGLGGALPCYFALVSEYAPARRRATFVALMWTGYSGGSLCSGLIASYILAQYTWKAAFYFGSLLPLVLVVIIALWLPESLRLLVTWGRSDERVARIVRQIAPDVPAGAQFTAVGESVERVPVRTLFTDGRGGQTMLIWIAIALTYGTLASVALWTPALLKQNGIPAAVAAMALTFYGLGGMIGGGLAGRLIERYGAVGGLLPSLIVGAVAIAILGIAGASIQIASTFMAVTSFLVGLGGSGVVAIAARIYPTSARATGLGWANTLGRVGQFTLPIGVGSLIGAAWSMPQTYLLLAAGPIVAGIAIVALQAMQRRLELPLELKTPAVSTI